MSIFQFLRSKNYLFRNNTSRFYIRFLCESPNKLLNRLSCFVLVWVRVLINKADPQPLLSGKINKYIDIIGFAGLVPDSLTDLFADAARTNEDFF